PTAMSWFTSSPERLGGPYLSTHTFNPIFAGFSMPTSRTSTTGISATAISPATSQRLVAALPSLNLASPSAAASQLAAMKATPDEFAPAFRRLAREDATRARNLALAFDDTLNTDEALGRQFEFVARATPEERKIVLDAYRANGRSKRIVHAVGRLPAA